MKPFRSILLIFGIFPTVFLFAQEQQKEVPFSMRNSMEAYFSDQAPLPSEQLSGLDLQRLQEEDLRAPGTRFAAPARADFDLQQSGVWTTLPDGSGVWRMKVEAPSTALGLIALYDIFYLPPGAKLYMYRPDGKYVDGPFSADQNNPDGHFITGLIPGNQAIIEYYEPAAYRGQGRLHIFRVDQAYHRENLLASGLTPGSALGEELGYGSSGNCHSNINCAEGVQFAEEKRALCRVVLVLEEGTGYCTGALVNNTRNDGRPLLISAFHCQDGYTPKYSFWRFDFNYESGECANPASEPMPNSIIGCRQLSGYRQTDFLLLELTRTLPRNYNTYFLGWDRQDVAPESGAILHHPRGDIKKFALDRDQVIIFPDAIQWNNEVTTPPGNHLRARYDFGSFDIGSSGAPLLNQQHHYVGQLHGGSVSCTGSTAYFGRLAISWEGGGTATSRLKDWLDPLGQNTLTLNGIENPYNTGGQVAGVVATETGSGVSGALVSLKSSGGFSAEVRTDSLGRFMLSPVPFGLPIEVSVSKADSPLNGLSVLDLVKVQKHILNLELLESPLQWIAADVNASRTISTLDLIQIRKVLLGLEAEFKSLPTWVFVPADFEFPAGPNPFAESLQIPQKVSLLNFSSDILDMDFIGVKAGDVNGSANPKQ